MHDSWFLVNIGIFRSDLTDLHGCHSEKKGAFRIHIWTPVKIVDLYDCTPGISANPGDDKILVDPASSDMLVSKIKPCMSQNQF